MGLDALLTRLENRNVTSVTVDVTPATLNKLTVLVTCTDDTPVTAQNIVVRTEKSFNQQIENTAHKQFEFEERAAIMEFDGGLPHEEAEQLAWQDLQSNQKLNAQTYEVDHG